jgi:hypothetical protein
VDGLHSKGAGHNNSAGRIRNIYTSVNHSFVSWNTMELQACVGHSCERAAASCNYYCPAGASGYVQFGNYFGLNSTFWEETHVQFCSDKYESKINMRNLRFDQSFRIEAA